MYSKTDKQNKSMTKPTILKVAQQIQDEFQTRNEALSIINAYRKIQNMNAHKYNIPQKKIDQSKSLAHKPQSAYANKVKQTLKQLNANRKKQFETPKQIEKIIPTSYKKILNPDIKNLRERGIWQFIKVIYKKYSANAKNVLEKLIKNENLMRINIQQRIKQWKLKRLFAGWQYQVVLSRIERQRNEKQVMEKQKKQMSLAIDFNYFMTIKKFYKKWAQQTKKALKKRQFEFEQNLKREQQLQRIKILKQQKVHINQVRTNMELQSKIRGFLDGLKQQIESKDRLKTIKQNTQNSYMNQNQIIEEDLNTNQQNFQQINNETNPNQQNQLNENNAVEMEHVGPLSNQDLQKRRKQLQKKAKNRKQALDKLKKAKQQKKKEEQEERIRIQKQIQSQQRKLRQQQYRKFIKQKKQQQQWEAKQKQLTKQAIQFDSLRLKRYYGWIYWVKLKQTNRVKIQNMYNLLKKILMRVNLQQFIVKAIQVSEEKTAILQEKMKKYWIKKLMKNCLKRFKKNKLIQLNLKSELTIRHSIYTLKIYFIQWKRIRNMIQLQNYEWQRPRIKKAEFLHCITLLNKSLKALKINKDEQIEYRNIQQNKKKIKQKVHNIVEQQSTINYDDFL